MRASSLTPLLMTSRRRWLPASGARVAPVRRMLAMRPMMRADREPTRKLGREMDTCSAAQRSNTVSNRVSSAE